MLCVAGYTAMSPGNVKKCSERTRSEAREGDKRSSDGDSALQARISHSQNAQLQRLADRLCAIDHVEFAQYFLHMILDC